MNPGPAVAHFDRRIHSTVCAAAIKPPFKVSEVCAFLVNLRKTYHGYVEEARRLAGTAARS